MSAEKNKQCTVHLLHLRMHLTQYSTNIQQTNKLASQFSFLFWPVKLQCKLQNAVSYHTCFTILLWASKAKMYPPKDKYIISNFFGQPLYDVLHVGSQRSQKCVWPTGRPAALVVDYMSVKGGHTSGEVCVRESGRIKSRVDDRNRSGVSFQSKYIIWHSKLNEKCNLVWEKTCERFHMFEHQVSIS